MGYCHRCGTYAALGPAAMCRACRASWRPAAAPDGDLGYRMLTVPVTPARAGPDESGAGCLGASSAGS